MSTPETRRQLLAAVAACDDKKGEDTRILELDPADSGLADFFLITSASNDRQAVAIADEIEMRLKKEFGLYATSVEGRRQAEWILLDYIDIVIHVFLAEKRAFYDIERLRKSAQTKTAPEIEADLKAALTEKTLAVRKKAPAKKAAATTAKKSAAVKKASASKASAKKAVAKKAAPKKAGVKTVAKKAAAGKAAARKTPAKAVKAVAKSPKKAAKKATAAAAPAKKAAKKAARAKAIPKPRSAK
jgi:ribosome-associated protein